MPAWGDDGNIYFVSFLNIYRVSAAGGAPEEVYTLGEGDSLGPRLQVLPGSRGLLTEGFGPEERIIVVLNWLEMLRRQTSGQ